ncbi:MAG: hypothetical protein KG003_09725 [Bacteroidetes bacterium]|nr:hypothetical protein [Bacteroidota bacterium]
MSNLENNIKNKLYNLETPLGGNVSFEKVMAMRTKERGNIWWKPTLMVASILGVVSLTGYYFYQKYSNPSETVSQISDSKNQGSSDVGDKSNNPVASEKSPTQNSMENASISASEMQNANAGSGKRAIYPARRNRDLIPSEGPIENPVEREVAGNITENIWTDWSGLHSFGLHEKWEKYSLASNDKRLKYKHKRVDNKDPKVLPEIELMMATGNRNVKEYATLNSYAVRGIHRYTQFSASALWDLGKGWKAGAGVGYSQFAGNGEWRNLYPVTTQKVRIDTTIIVQPGFPDKQVITRDTTYVTTNEIQTGKLSYTLSKISIPLSFQYYLGRGTTLFRLNGTVAPGWLSAENGQIFSKEDSRNTTGSINQMTLDGRLGMGLYYVLNKRTAIIIEPGATYQSVLGHGWNTYNRIGFGMGFGLMIKL